MTVVAVDPEVLACATCGVEYGTAGAELPAVCPICADERQYVPSTGQAWLSQAQLAERSDVRIAEAGGGRWGVTAAGVGIGQTMQVVRTGAGTLLWDPIGLVDIATVEFVRALGPVLAIVASHPHMYGAQVSWSHALGDAPVLVNSADAEWVQRHDPVIAPWSGTLRLTDDLELRTLGGHFPGSAVAHWSGGVGGVAGVGGAGSRGVVLAGDTIMVNPDGETVSFMRSYPNRIPLSGAVVERIARDIADLRYDEIWSNFGNAITEGADAKVQRSAERHLRWTRGDFDGLT